MGLEVGIFLVILLIGLAIMYGRLLLQRRQELQRQDQLKQQINRFLENPFPPAYSVADDNYSSLENAVAELQSRILFADDKTRRESHKSIDFAADISHQLKTPLAAMRLYCELDAGQGQHSKEMLELTVRLEKMIQSLLLIEKLKADSYQMKFKSCDLHALIMQVWTELHPLFPERCLIVAGDARLRMDSEWMGEALLNILKNACELPATNPAIEINITKAEASVMIALSDHGGGVPDAELAKIFERFHRSANNQVPGNTGLGLAITRTIVEKHHGTIYAVNQGDGLCISICLPVLDGRLTY